MSNRIYFVPRLLLAAVHLTLVIGQPIRAQVPTDSLVTVLRAGAPVERREAIQTILQMPVGHRGPAIRAAVVQELERQRAELETRRTAIKAGVAIPPAEGHGEYLFQLLEVLIQYNDPANVEHLAPFVGTGNRVMNALAAFGEQALPAIVSVAEAPESSERDVASALRTLGRILEQRGSTLSEESTRRIVSVTRQRLSGTQGPTTVMMAINLALDTGDAELENRVRTLASDADEIRALGIRDEEGLVEHVQNHAISALKGGG